MVAGERPDLRMAGVDEAKAYLLDDIE